MKRLVFVLLIFDCLFCSGQNKSFDKWEKKILSNISFEKTRYSIEHDSLTAFYKKKEIPKSLIDTLRQWSREFNFANPNEKYRSTDVVISRKIPSRQIIMILKNENNIFITYKHGGLGFHHHILWAETENNIVKDIWIGVTFNDLDTIDKIRNVLSEDPEDLNTNMVCF